MNKDALRKFYESVLPLMGLTIGDDDFLNTFYFDDEGQIQSIPMMVNNLGVIFPTDAVLREGKWKDRVGFHPLSESTTRGVSPVILSTAAALKFKIYQAIFYAGTSLIKVAKESREGTIKNLPAKLVEVLGSLPKTVDAKSLSFFSKVMAAGNDTDRAIVKVCIKRNGSIMGTDYKRTTSIYFPIYEQICEAVEKKESEFWGVVAARKTDLNLVKEILEIILPDINDENRYCAGTFVNTAPYLDSLIQAAAKVQDSLNATFEVLDKYMPSAIRSALQADTSWLEEETDLRELRNVIPPLRFNEGEITEEEEEERLKDVTRVRPTRPEKSNEIPDFGAKGENSVKRASEQKAPQRQVGGRRYIDNTLTEEERRDPERAERRMSSDRYDDDDYPRSRDRDRRDRRDDRYESRGRGSDRGRRSDRYDDRRDRGRDRYDDRGGRRNSGGWLERNHERREDRSERRRR